MKTKDWHKYKVTIKYSIQNFNLQISYLIIFFENCKCDQPNNWLLNLWCLKNGYYISVITLKSFRNQNRLLIIIDRSKRYLFFIYIPAISIP